ncbi:prepilin-type N-terminal cleavage/methylation domain-containing protein [Streptomyces sp. NPDC012765]|uniref:type IV pilin protein n=1 Tax=Streptomyces sp. NPDC012765 TaxID=3155249 RepID=UPI0033D9796C
MSTYLQGTLRRRTGARNETAEAGFTLIELLVVIVILGILSAIVVFSVRGINDKGQGSACKTDKSTIQTAEEAYFATNNKYGDMAALEVGGFLSGASQWHKVTLSNGDKAYAVEPIPGQPCNGA